MTIKDHIQGTAKFEYLRDSALWYRTSTGILFSVPLDDTKGATFEAEPKGIYLMRWIRKHLAAQEKIDAEIAAAREDLKKLTKGDIAA
jgi:hypothetical protein